MHQTVPSQEQRQASLPWPWDCGTSVHGDTYADTLYVAGPGTMVPVCMVTHGQVLYILTDEEELQFAVCGWSRLKVVGTRALTSSWMAYEDLPGTGQG